MIATHTHTHTHTHTLTHLHMLRFMASTASRFTDKNWGSGRLSVFGIETEHSPFICGSYLVFCILIFFHVRSLQTIFVGITKFFSGGNRVACSTMECCPLINVIMNIHHWHSVEANLIAIRIYRSVCDIISKLEIWELENFKKNSLKNFKIARTHNF
jgi:hypothetical protein